LKASPLYAIAAVALLLSGSLVFAAALARANGPLAVELTVAHGPQQPAAVPVLDRNCYLSLIDAVLDATRSVESFEFRCVTTESLLGIQGATMLEAN